VCVYLCVGKLPSLNYTKEITIFRPASNPSEAVPLGDFRSVALQFAHIENDSGYWKTSYGS